MNKIIYGDMIISGTDLEKLNTYITQLADNLKSQKEFTDMLYTHKSLKRTVDKNSTMEYFEERALIKIKLREKYATQLNLEDDIHCAIAHLPNDKVRKFLYEREKHLKQQRALARKNNNTQQLNLVDQELTATNIARKTYNKLIAMTK